MVMAGISGTGCDDVGRAREAVEWCGVVRLCGHGQPSAGGMERLLYDYDVKSCRAVPGYSGVSAEGEDLNCPR